jgi:hypothetical protein
MALPSSGQISISSSAFSDNTQVSSETIQKGKAFNYSLQRLSKGDSDRYYGNSLTSGYTGINQNSTTKPDRTAQYSLSEFYSYNHTENGSCSGTSFGDALTSLISDDRRSYHRISVSGNVGDIVVITVVCPASSGTPPFGPFTNGYYNIYNTYPFDSFGALVATPLFSGYTSNTTNTHRYTLLTTSDIIHIVAYSGLEGVL